HEAAGKGKSSERGQGKESYEDVAVIGFDLRARPADFFLVGARQRVEAVVESRSDGAVGIVVAEGARSRRALVFSKTHELGAEANEAVDAPRQLVHVGLLPGNGVCLPPARRLLQLRQVRRQSLSER